MVFRWKGTPLLRRRRTIHGCEHLQTTQFHFRRSRTTDEALQRHHRQRDAQLRCHSRRTIHWYSAHRFARSSIRSHQPANPSRAPLVRGTEAARSGEIRLHAFEAEYPLSDATDLDAEWLALL